MSPMVIDMNDSQLHTVSQLRAFLDGSLAMKFSPPGNDLERYGFITAVLKRLHYQRLGRSDKGVVRRYLCSITGYSRSQLTRLIRRGLRGAALTKRYAPPLQGFARKFTAADVALLAHTDALHGTLSGPATKVLMQRAWLLYRDTSYERLANISVSHIYNLRAQAGYQAKRLHWTKTKGYAVPIAVRRAPAPDGRPGFIRIDSVHQGDQDGAKGVYHINAVDAVTQFELVATCERISEAYLLPVLRELLAGFPFVILGFHADNGSEYINRQVSRLLEKLRIEFTKSRPRHSNDNALAESKNGAIVRKHLGYGHIPQRFAGAINTFCREFLNPYVNFHRPCFFAQEVIDDNGKTRKLYRLEGMKTPYEKLKSLPNAERFLRPGFSFKQLEALAGSLSDNEAARRLNEARTKLFQAIHRRPKHVA